MPDAETIARTKAKIKEIDPTFFERLENYSDTMKRLEPIIENRPADMTDDEFQKLKFEYIKSRVYFNLLGSILLKSNERSEYGTENCYLTRLKEKLESMMKVFRACGYTEQADEFEAGLELLCKSVELDNIIITYVSSVTAAIRLCIKLRSFCGEHEELKRFEPHISELIKAGDNNFRFLFE